MIKGSDIFPGHDMINPDHPSREYGLYLKKEDGTIKTLLCRYGTGGSFMNRSSVSLLRAQKRLTHEREKGG